MNPSDYFSSRLSSYVTFLYQVREVRPISFSSLTPGTRVLANWSPKLRGLFPGTVTEGASPEPGMLYVEFDDGDSGYMRLEGIRMLPRDYPTVGE